MELRWLEFASAHPTTNSGAGLAKFDDAFVDATSETLSDLSLRTCVVNEFAGGEVILRSSSAKSG